MQRRKTGSIPHVPLIVFMALGSALAQTSEPIITASEFGPVPEEVVRFTGRLSPGVRRYLWRNESVRRSGTPADPLALEDARESSAAWVRALLRPEFVPNDLDARIRGIVAGLRPVDEKATFHLAAPCDCTTATFEAGGFRFDVVQDSLSITVFVLPTEVEGRTPTRGPLELANSLRTRSEQLFRHVPASFYLYAIRLSDFGVELTTPNEVWYLDERQWRSTCIVPPQACLDGLMDPMSDPRMMGSDRIAPRMRELDPTLSPNFGDHDLAKWWWGWVYAATDGRVLVYSAAKASPGQMVGAPVVPDWFRISHDEDLDPDGSKAGQTRPKNVPWPPKE